MPTRALAEGLARLEHKVDAMLRHFKVPTRPLHFIGEECPVCHKPIEYQIEIMLNVVVRKCGCSTGKLPSGIQLLSSGDSNVSSSSKSSTASQAPDSSGGSEGESGSRKLRR